MRDDEAVWVHVGEVFDAVGELLSETAWSESYVAVPVAEVGHRAADDALGRAGFLLRNLPCAYSEQLGNCADAVVHGAVDVQMADRAYGGDGNEQV